MGNLVIKIRGVLLIFTMSITMIIYSPIPVIAQFFVSEKLSYHIATAWGLFTLKLIKYIGGVDYRITGKENIPKDACVVLSKHQSALDIFVLLAVFSPQTWVFKKELLKIPFFGWSVRATKPIPIDRSAGRKAMKDLIEIGSRKLKNGFWVVMYPEGTRVPPGERGVYKSGGIILAQRAGVDIIPVALNTGLFWKKGKGLQNTGVVDIVVGKKIVTKDRKTREVLEEVENSIEDSAAKIILNHPCYIGNSKEGK